MNTLSKINLSNLKKCNQVWADMPKDERGRLCIKCNNTIIDFRKLTDIQIAEAHLFSEKKVCGLYKPEQLQKPSKDAKTLKLNNWNPFYFGLFSFLSFNSLGQENIKPSNTEQTENKYDSINRFIQKENIEIPSVVIDSIFVTGRFTDEDDEPMPFANVLIKGTRVGVSSDINGFYRLDITEELDSLGILTLSYRFIGYGTIERTIDSKLITKEEDLVINIKLEGRIDMISFSVVERVPFHKKVWSRIKSIFRK